VGQGLGVLGNFGRSKQLRGKELPKEIYKRSGGPVVNIPVAQAFRPEVYSRSGAVTVGAKPLTPGRKGASYRLRRCTGSGCRPSLGLLAFQPGMCELQGIQE
jgi:hypothetical protein